MFALGQTSKLMQITVLLFFFILPKTTPFGLVKAKATAVLIVFSSSSFHFLFLFVSELIPRDKIQLQNP